MSSDFASCPFRIQRLTDADAGEQIAITPPIDCSSVRISNRTTGDVRLESVSDGSEYGIISSCFEELIDLSQSGPCVSLFHRNQIAFWLRVMAGADAANPIVLTWV